MTDGRTAREARLAAALRDNLKRRKAAASPTSDHAAGTQRDAGAPEGAEGRDAVPPSDETRRG